MTGQRTTAAVTRSLLDDESDEEDAEVGEDEDDDDEGEVLEIAHRREPKATVGSDLSARDEGIEEAVPLEVRRPG